MGRIRRTPELTGGSEGTRLGQQGEATTDRLIFTPEAAPAFLQQLQEKLRKPAVTEVTIDMAEVTYLSPEALGVLAAAGTHARAAGKRLLLDHTRTPVYKTLQLAQLAALFRRVHNG